MFVNLMRIVLLLTCFQYGAGIPFVALSPLPFIVTYVGHSVYRFITEERCSSAVYFNQTGLEDSLKRELHGQHIVSERVLNHVVAHMRDPSPQKPLVLSFHGYTGVGKNFVTSIIVRHILKYGSNSRFYHFYDSVIHFKHPEKINQYKEQLHNDIVTAVTACPTSIFVFDEMHNMPSGLLDILAPFLEIRESLDGVDFRKTIFLFLSNAGGNDLSKLTYDHLKSGMKREDLSYVDLGRFVTKSAYNNKGGLLYSELIEKHLITAMIPFLPLEAEHVRMCVRDAAERRNVTFTEEMINFVFDELEWFPENSRFFSVSGCKRVYEKVGFYIQQL